MVLEGAEYEHLTFFNNQNFMKQKFLCFGHEMTDATKMIKTIVRTLDTFLIEEMLLLNFPTTQEPRRV